MNCIKIGITGTHGAGKTTLALSLAAMMKTFFPELKIGVASETARECPWPVNRETSENAQTWIFHRQVLKELEASGRNDILVCDRTILDNLAYAYQAGMYSLVKRLHPTALDWLRSYRVLLWTRPGDREPVDDGFRDTDRNFQLQIDNQLKHWLKSETFDLPVFECAARAADGIFKTCVQPLVEEVRR